MLMTKNIYHFHKYVKVKQMLWSGYYTLETEISVGNRIILKYICIRIGSITEDLMKWNQTPWIMIFKQCTIKYVNTRKAALWEPAQNQCKWSAAQHVHSYYESCCWNIIVEMYATLITHEWVADWGSELITEWMSGWLREWVADWVSEWLTEGVSCWLSEWVTDWVSELQIGVLFEAGIANIKAFLKTRQLPPHITALKRCLHTHNQSHSAEVCAASLIISHNSRIYCPMWLPTIQEAACKDL